MADVQRFGSYYLLKKIATGGMAELYKAKKSGEQGFEKMLAVKQILPHLSANEEFVSMFVDEAKVAALLNHQNIVQIYDLGRIEGSYCIVMEYVRGKDLRAILTKGAKAGKPLKIEDACYIISAVLAGLSHAHRKKDKGKELKIVHRDISPQNVLVSYEGEVKIVDFGIAKAATQSSDTRVGVLKGKVSYMSPEQARGQALDMRSDIFSSGTVFYELLTGRRLFKGDNDLNTLEKVREAKVVPLPSELNTGVPKELEAILLRSLAQEPDRRYQSAEEMEAALMAFMKKAGYQVGGHELGRYMHALFAEEIDAEQKEDEQWDQTMVTDAEKTRVRTPTPAVPKAQVKPRPAPSVRPLAARAAQTQVRVHKGRGGPSLLTVALLLVLAVVGGAYAWLNFGPAKGRYQLTLNSPVRVVPKAQPAPAPPPVAPPKAPQPPAPAPAEAAPPEKAGATVSSEPAGADVYVDGEHRGITPLALGGIEPGRHTLRIEKAGYRPWTATKAVRPGGGYTINAALEEIGFTLSVGSEPPGAKVYIDGTDTGRTAPARLEGLKPGRAYRVRLALDGYAPHEETVSSPDGRAASVMVTLARQYGRFNINSKPWFFVQVDGEDKGTTPLAGIKLPAGTHDLLLVNPKLGIKRQVKLRIEADKTTSIIIGPNMDPPLKEIIR